MSISKSVIDRTKSYIESNSLLFDKYKINLEKLLLAENIKLKEYPFEENISGVLNINENGVTIGYNSSLKKERKRFTIAHELGHFVLHNDEPKVFMDKVFFRKNSGGYTSKDEKIEKEANYFAASILMPENFIRKEMSVLECDLHDDSTISQMARKFGVSSSAMLYRLINLNIL
ncbi:ImmA/IrrE family metallo-endopeptidase [Epilithonimonas sp. JDS]|uniref:ImmA/IrrE family metallo-endopeptidase n=1 Tax=Epilithonimonas sp. JDS TaxID=2902797 RepID=UPI001E2845DE|nr:ImmA/IrrE family metallo-endopeptidase [Epilithonimonas sp. JDS]MCD9853841.1 ImmA/IrrE family metallo-endopeptidase [Epilithonimonas sp. JDS]